MAGMKRSSSFEAARQNGIFCLIKVGVATHAGYPSLDSEGRNVAERFALIKGSGVGRILEGKEIACGDGLTGTGNSLVKSLRSRKKGGEARL